MTDLNPDVPDRPVVVPASPASLQAATVARDLMIVVSVLPTLIAVLGTHNLTAIVAFLTGQQFASALGVLTLASTMLWRQWIARRQHADDVKMASASPNSVALVKEPTR